MVHYRTKTAEEIAGIIRSTAGSFNLQSLGTKHQIGHTIEQSHVLDLSAFSGIIAYEPEELILEVGAATPLREIEELLASHNQMLAFEPPHVFRESPGSIGGVVACNLSGPRRLTAGAARDHMLGVSGVDGRGTLFKGGGRVVKNVTGYDMPKLLSGSYGTLAAITSLVVKVLPKPETEVTLLVPAREPAAAVRVMSQAMATPFAVSCAAYAPDHGVCLRLEGIASSVAARRDGLRAVIGLPVEILEGQASANPWYAIRELQLLARRKSAVVWRISVTPNEAPQLLAKLQDEMDIDYLMDWAGGLVWIGTTDVTVNVRDHMISGHAILFKAPAEMKQRIPVFQPQARALAALSARLKQAFDPEHKLNPGRMYKGV